MGNGRVTLAWLAGVCVLWSGLAGCGTGGAGGAAAPRDVAAPREVAPDTATDTAVPTCRPAPDCRCGDGACEPDRCCERWDEQGRTCATDCAVCPNSTCDPGEGVNGPHACFADCCGACGDQWCRGGECGEDNPEDARHCDQDCTLTACGDGVCEAPEDPTSCRQDCQRFACGNRVCEPGEDFGECPRDCAPSCGDCVCEGGEDFASCPVDCGYCGDGYCITRCPYLIAENADTCPYDCPAKPPDDDVSGPPPGDVVADGADSSAAVAVPFSGMVDADTTWSGAVRLTGDVVVADGVTLTIAAGTLVLVAPTDDQVLVDELDPDRIEVRVRGTLAIRGGPAAPVAIRSSAAAPTSGDWFGIRVDDLGRLSMEHADVAHAAFGVQVGANAREASIVASTLHDVGSGFVGCPTEFRDTTVRRAQAFGLDADRCQTVVVTSSDFIECGGGIRVQEGIGTAVIDGCTVEDTVTDEGLTVTVLGTATLRGTTVRGSASVGAFVAAVGTRVEHCLFEYNATGLSASVQIDVHDSEFRGNGIGLTVPTTAGAVARVFADNFLDNDVDVEVTGPADVDARGNYWGDPGATLATTAWEMASRPYPSDIATLADRFDLGGKGFVHYDQWLAGPVDPAADNFVVTIETPDAWVPIPGPASLSVRVPEAFSVPDANVVWSSDLAGALGTGRTLADVGLIPGVHRITVTATAESGEAASASTLLTVADPALTTVGTLPGNQTWSGVVDLSGDVVVPVGAQLTITAGTEVRPAGLDLLRAGSDSDRVEIVVEGNLVVDGTEEAPVLIGAGLAAGTWYGVRVAQFGMLTMHGADLAGAVRGVVVEWQALIAEITSSVFHDVSDVGVYGCPTMLDSVRVEDAPTAGLRLGCLPVPTVTYTNLELRRMAAYGIYVEGSSEIALRGLVVSDAGSGVAGGFRLTVEDATITLCGVGVSSSDFLVLRNARIASCERGIDVGGALDAQTVELSGNTTGLFGGGTECGRISGSNFFDNGLEVDWRGECDLDARGNYWGDPANPASTTAEMNTGGNPKNLLRIVDGYDQASSAFVDYADFVQAPFAVAP